MDRFAKTMRQSHRNAGHDIKSLIEMIIIFRHKYDPTEILKAWIIHNVVDKFDMRIKTSIRKDNPKYGKKKSNIENQIDELKSKLIKEGMLK